MADFGGNKFGGRTFGGNQFGGAKFGGNQFGASQDLARLLIGAQAPPPVGPQSFNAPLPPVVTAADFAQPAVPPAVQQPPQGIPPVPPQAGPAGGPQAVSLPPAVPPIPETVPVGMDPAQPDVRAVLEAQRRAFQNAPAPWTINQGNFRDQTG